MKFRLLLLLPLVACLLLTSCVVISVHPLSAPESAQPDPALVGVWQEKGKTDDEVTFSIKDAHWMHVEERVKGQTTLSCDFFVTVIGDNRFVNIRNLDPKQPGYTLMRYETITGRGVLMTWGIDPDLAARAVRAGRLKGAIFESHSTVARANRDVDVRFQSDSEALAQFVREEGFQALFTKAGTPLYRLR